MALSPTDIETFITALHEDAALRERVREAVLSDDFLALPQAVRVLDERVTKAHAAHVVRMDQLDELIRELDLRLTQRLDAITERLDTMAERLDAMTVRMGSMASTLEQHTSLLIQLQSQSTSAEREFDKLQRDIRGIDGQLGNLRGRQFESDYRQNLASHLSKHFRRVRRALPSDFDVVFDAYRSGVISSDDWDDLRRIDVIATGSRRDEPGELTLAIELSLAIDNSDVIRAKRRADILRRAGIEAEPAVDGERIISAARTLANDLSVTVLVDDSSTESAA